MFWEREPCFKAVNGRKRMDRKELKRRQLIQVGNADNKEHATTRIYSEEGLSPSLTAMQGGDRQPKVAQVVAVASRGRYDGKGGTQQQLELRKDSVSNALTTVQSDSMITQNFKVRRLTPLECWRLMGFTDEDFNKSQKVLSNTKLYERAGRGIVVPMLEAVFEKLLIPK